MDRPGLVHDATPELTDGQRVFARPWEDVGGWDRDGDGRITLAETVRRVAPHVLVGVTGVQGLFTEEVVRAAAAGVAHPIVLPLSNPTLRAEAVPEDVLAWTDGRALVGTGSPFPPVVLDGVVHEIAQVNNAYVFPGVGLGVVAVRARAVSDAMITAAATAVGTMTTAADRPGAPLLPSLTQARTVARCVAEAVACCAVEEGLAPPHTPAEVAAAVAATVWEPRYDPD